MNTPAPFLTLLGAALLAAATVNCEAQTWQTILPDPDFAPGWTGSAALIDPSSADPSVPGVFIGCWSDSAQGIGSVVRVDPQGNHSVADTELSRVYGLGHNPAAAALYAVGDGLRVTVPPFPRSNPTTWKVLESVTGGGAGSWSTDDEFYLSSKTASSARGTTTDTDGSVYVCGLAYPNRGGAHWIVRKLPPDGVWATVSDQSSPTGVNAIASGMCIFSGNANNATKAVFAVGTLNSKWTVLRSQNQGASWQLVDAWSPGNKLAAGATGAACDAAGNLYVVGHRGTGTYPTGWVVRMSANGGDTWTPLLDVAEGAYSWAASVGADANGDIWVCGMTQNTSGTSRWTMLRHSASETWSQSWGFRQLPFGETYSKARGIASNPAGGDVFVTGELRWPDGTSRVAVQRLQP